MTLARAAPISSRDGGSAVRRSCSGDQVVANSVPDTQPKFFEKNYLRPASFLRRSLPLIALSGARTATYAGGRLAVSRMSPRSGRVIAAVSVAELRGMTKSWRREHSRPAEALAKAELARKIAELIA
jgi:hypothetical protein